MTMAGRSGCRWKRSPTYTASPSLRALERGSFRAALAPRRHARMALERQAELRPEQQPARLGYVHEREAAHHVVAVREPRFQRIEQSVELDAVVGRARLAAVLRLVRDRRVEP